MIGCDDTMIAVDCAGRNEGYTIADMEIVAASLGEHRLQFNHMWMCQSWNISFERLLGYSAEEIRNGLHFFDLFESSVEFVNVWRAVDKRNRFTGYVKIKTKDGRAIAAWLWIEKRRRAKRGSPGYQVTVLDPSDMERLGEMVDVHVRRQNKGLAADADAMIMAFTKRIDELECVNRSDAQYDH